MTERSKGELAFIDQFTRKLMVEWGRQCLAHGSLNEPTKADLGNDLTMACVEHALTKGWLTKREPRKLTARGWSVAVSFLKR